MTLRTQQLLGDATNPSHIDYLGDRIDELESLLARVEDGEEIDLELIGYQQVVREGVQAAFQFVPGSEVFAIPRRVAEMRTLGGFANYVAAKRQAA